MAKLISIGQIIDRSWQHYTHNLKELLKISLWFFLIPLMLIIGFFLAPDNLTYLPSGSMSALAVFGLILRASASLIIAPVTAVWVFLNLVIMIDNQVHNKKFDRSATNRRAWRLFLPYLWVTFLKYLVIVAPFLLIVPGMALIFLNLLTESGLIVGTLSIFLTFLGTILAFIFVVKFSVELAFVKFDFVLADGRGPSTIRHSRALTRGRWWATFWRLVLPYLLFGLGFFIASWVLAACYSFLSLALSGFGSEIASAISQIMPTIINYAFLAFSTPLFVIVGYLVYDSLNKNQPSA